MDSEVIEPGTALATVVPETLNAVVVFAPGGVDDILAKIKATALLDASKLDISTPKGRAAIASLALKVARSKTALEKMGKELGEDHYKQWKSIAAERNKIEAELDALKAEVRKPLTNWENADKERVAAHEDALADIGLIVSEASDGSSAAYRHRLDLLENLPPRKWKEFQARADSALKLARESLENMLANATRREAEQAELERLRAEEIARQQRERDEKIAKDAADRARREAEEKAERESAEAAQKAEQARLVVEQKAEEERRAAQKRIDDANAAAERAEGERLASEKRAADAKAKAAADAKLATEKAEREKQDAIEAERARVAAAKVAEDAETARREADTKHRAKVNNTAKDAIMALGISETMAKAVVAAIAKGEIPHTKIEY